jgi:PadR family transcriptional regulator, regulatory protein AphA
VFVSEHAELLEKLSVSALGLMAILSEHPMTGYELKKLIDEPEFIYWRDSFGSIYPNLKKITDLKLAEVSRAESRGRRRKVYSLTAKGRVIVLEWLCMPATKRPVKIELLLKLRFAYPLGRDVILKLLREYRDYHKEILPDFYENLQYLEGFDSLSLQTETQQINADFWYRFTRMLIEWAESSIRRLDSTSK